VFIWPDGQHSEWFWKREFPSGFKFLFHDNNPTKLTENKWSKKTDSPTLFYDKAQQKVIIRQNLNMVYELLLFSVDGKIMLKEKISQGFDLSLKQGIYFYKLIDNELIDYNGKMVVY
jgi:hypothetical protein